MPSEKRRGNGRKLKHKKWHLHLGKILHAVWVVRHWKRWYSLDGFTGWMDKFLLQLTLL